MSGQRIARMWPNNPIIEDLDGNPIGVAAPYVLTGDATENDGVCGWVTPQEDEQ